MYLTWCSTANRSSSSRPAIRDWVALHAGGAFAEQVAWGRAEIDERAPRLNASAQARLTALFEQALSAETAFHDAVYVEFEGIDAASLFPSEVWSEVTYATTST